MALFDTGKGKRLNLANGNYIDVKPVMSGLDFVNRYHAIAGDRQVSGQPVEIDSAMYRLSTCQQRITGWKLIETDPDDGSVDELPYSYENVGKLNDELLDQVYAFINELDTKAKAAFGTNDPNV